MFLVKLDEAGVVMERFPLSDTALLPLSIDLAGYVILGMPAIQGQTYDRVTGQLSGPSRKRWVTNLSFDNRFTVDERVNIEMAALVEPGMTVEQKRQAISLQVELGRAKKATYVDLGRADTRAGVVQFETFGLMAPGRAIEILDGPIEAHEYYPEA